MVKQIYLVFRDGGHGEDTSGKRTPYIKALGHIIHEHEFNQPVSDFLGEELERHGIITVDVAPGGKDHSLQSRTDKANRIYWDYVRKYGKENVHAVYASIHFNAFDGSFGGADPHGNEIYIYPSVKGTATEKLAQMVGKYLRQGTAQNWRGINTANFHVLRETAMHAFLSENGFMDNKREALLMLNGDFQRETAKEHAQGILEFFGMKYKEASNKYYRVVTGSFTNKDKAEERMDYIKDKTGLDSFLSLYEG